MTPAIFHEICFMLLVAFVSFMAGFGIAHHMPSDCKKQLERIGYKCTNAFSAKVNCHNCGKEQ